ncbi:hypothetical protein ACI3QN_13955, partial [Propionibacterium freudenreichii]|uniref:hypothetical protein n=1 Tax=Propionibacterium freudenreichii TaxID=1744 RepID=UPI0038549832
TQGLAAKLRSGLASNRSPEHPAEVSRALCRNVANRARTRRGVVAHVDCPAARDHADQSLR